MMSLVYSEAVSEPRTDGVGSVVVLAASLNLILLDGFFHFYFRFGGDGVSDTKSSAVKSDVNSYHPAFQHLWLAISSQPSGA